MACAAAKCAASFAFNGAAGWYTIHVQYFDQSDGAARFELSVNGERGGSMERGRWETGLRRRCRRGGVSIPPSSTRRSIEGIMLEPGDIVRLEGTPDKTEVAAFDYIEVLPERN